MCNLQASNHKTRHGGNDITWHGLYCTALLIPFPSSATEPPGFLLSWCQNGVFFRDDFFFVVHSPLPLKPNSKDFRFEPCVFDLV